MTVRDKIDLLTTPVWTLKQLMDYTGIKSRTTGIRFRERAFKEHDGRVPYGNQFVKRDAVLAILGITAEEELKKLTED